MHYFKRNIGDYHKKAGRLTMLQHGAYTLLLDACYDREQFPTMEEALDWVWASTGEEEDAVKFVLSKFFDLEDGVYIQHRIESELKQYHKNSATNKRIAQEREAKRKEKSTKREQGVNEAPPNHKPLTINQEPSTNKPSAPRIDWDDLKNYFNEHMPIKKVNVINEKRKANIRKVLKSTGKDIETLKAHIENAAYSTTGFWEQWRLGNVDRDGKKWDPRDFDFYMQEKIFIKSLED